MLAGALLHASEKIGLLLSLGIIVVIFVCYKVSRVSSKKPDRGA